MIEDLRRPLRQRFVSDALCRRGRFEPMKLFSIVGMGILAWWLVKYADKLTSDVLSGATLVCLLIAPTFAHKIIGNAAAIRKPKE